MMPCFDRSVIVYLEVQHLSKRVLPYTAASLMFAESVGPLAAVTAGSAKHYVLVQAKAVFSSLPLPSQLASISGGSIHGEHVSTQ